MAGLHQFDGVGEIVDARGDHTRFGLGDDGPQLTDRGAGLQRNRHSANEDQRQVEDRVVDAGEAQHRLGPALWTPAQ